MPPIPSLAPALLDDLMAFLTKPESAPPGTAAPAAALAMVRSEPPYPEDVTPPPSRYKTGYGNEPYVITPPWSQDHRVRSEYRQDQMADAVWRPAAGRTER